MSHWDDFNNFLDENESCDAKITPSNPESYLLYDCIHNICQNNHNVIFLLGVSLEYWFQEASQFAYRKKLIICNAAISRANIVLVASVPPKLKEYK